MAEGTVQVAPDSTGKIIRTQEVTEGGKTVEQQVVTIANSDGTLVDSTTVNVGNFPATQPVSGTFFQATQPVSGTVTANAGTGPSTAWKVDLSATGANTTAVKVDGSGVTQPVSGTFWQATQPVSGTVTANDVPPALTKGTQGSTGFSVQNLHDAGRTFITFTVDQAAGSASKVLATMSINKAGTVTSSTNYTVTTGKTLRIQNFSLSIKQTNATMNNSLAYLVGTSSGTVATTSGVIDSLAASAGVATTNAIGLNEVAIPDGLEIPAGWNIGIAHIEIATTASIGISLNAYEY